MKRIVTVFIAIAVLLSSLTATVFAKEQSGKITSALAEKLADLPDGEKIATCVWLYYKHDAELIERKTYEECGLTAGTCMTLEEVHIYKKTYNRIAGELEAAGNKAFIEKSGVSAEDILFCGTLSPMVILNFTKGQVYSVSAFNEVLILDFDESFPEEVEPEIPSEPEIPAQPGRLYQNSFKQKYETQDEKTASYRELYYHHDGADNIDWALVSCKLNNAEPMPYSAVIGNRVILHDSCSLPFSSGYAVYDVREDRFINAGAKEAAAYDGFIKAVDNDVKEGRLLGDLDGDNEITAIDATIIQRCEVHIRDFPADDLIQPYGETQFALKYYSDFNRDGERDVVDATCIMRYSVGLPYHISK